MTEKVGYLSPQWRDEAEKRLKAEITPEKMNHLTTSVSYNYTNCPDGVDKYLYFKCVNGEFAEVGVDSGEPPKTDFRITGSYDIFSQVTQGKIKAQKALMTGKLKLKGNMVKALKLASLADRINKVLVTIPTNY